MSVSLIGKKIKYRYENGWEYHVHYEGETRVSYDVISGPFGSRHAYQQARYAEVAPNVFMIGWYEETGTIVVQVVNLNSMRINSFAGFPKWIFDNPQVAHGNKDDKMAGIMKLREKGPDAPRHIFFEVGEIFSVEEA